MSVEDKPVQEKAPRPPVRELTADEKAFSSAVVKRVRDESKKFGTPTPIADLEADATGLDADGIKAALDDAQERNKDIGRFMVFNAATFMFSDKYLDEELAHRLMRDEQMRGAIVRKVRTASEAGSPTPIDALRAISMDLTADELEARLAELAADEQTADIKRTIAFTGAVYFYSESFMSQERAEKAVRSEELQFKLVVEIRGDSKYLGKLTRIDAIKELAPDQRPGEIEAELDAIQKIEMFGDIHVLSARDGALYAVSEMSMTEQYAGILLRIEEKDPCYTIAETVREESRVYPRPTDIEIFKYALFDVDRKRLDEYVASVLEQFEDIKRYDDPKGTVYLYSDEYLTELQAEWYAKRDHSDG